MKWNNLFFIFLIIIISLSEERCSACTCECVHMTVHMFICTTAKKVLRWWSYHLCEQRARRILLASFKRIYGREAVNRFTMHAFNIRTKSSESRTNHMKWIWGACIIRRQMQFTHFFFLFFLPCFHWIGAIVHPSVWCTTAHNTQVPDTFGIRREKKMRNQRKTME